MSLEHLGNIAKQRGDFDEAERLYRIVLSQSIENRDRRRESQLLNKLGRIARKRGDFEKAERLHTEALNIDRQQDNRQGESQELARLGRIALDRGDHNAAEKLYRDSVRIVKELGSPFDQWFIDNGYTEPDAEWDFPPPRENSE
jgi:tetratricopeptide (TPR) repeat protein